MTTTPLVPSSRLPGRLWLMLGTGLAVFAITAYGIQIAAQRLMAPWYVPLAATVGLMMVFVSLCRQRTFWRVLVFLLMLLLTAAEWAMVYSLRLPAYAGPVAEGMPFPAFETTKADGSKFTQDDLKSGPNTVMVFFRGRW